MSRASRKWLRRVLFVSLVVIAALVLLALLVLGTQRGTRFTFQQVAKYSPLEIDPQRITGTLLGELNLPRAGYRDDSRTLVIERLSLNIDWSASGFRSLIVERLAIANVTMTAHAEEPAEKEPLEISMPPLPIELLVRDARIDTLVVDRLEVTGITASHLRARRTRFEIEDAAAIVETLSLEIRAAHIDLDGDVPLGGDVSWRLADGGFSGSGSLRGSLRQLEIAHQLEGDYRVTTDGTVQLLHELVPVLDLDNRFAELRYADWTASNGRVRVSGTPDQYRLAIDATLSAMDDIGAVVRGTAGGTLERFDEVDVMATFDSTELRARGSVGWAPELTLDLDLVGSNVDPSNFVELPASSIDGELHLRATGADDFVVDIRSLGGLWNQQAASVTGQLTRKPESWRCRTCRISVGDNRISVDGRTESRALRGDVDILAPALDQLWPGLAGSLSGTGRLGGTFALPRLTGQLSAAGLGFGGWSAGFISLESQNSTPEDIDVGVEFRELVFEASALGSGRIDIAGTPDIAALSARWNLDEYTAFARVNAEIGSDTVRGSIEAASFHEPVSGDWTLAAPVDFSFGPDTARLRAASWTNGDAELRHDDILRQQESLTIAAQLINAPLPVLNNFLPANMRLDGLADADVDLQHDIAGWRAGIEWRQRDTVLQLIVNEDEKHDMHLPLAEFSADICNNNATLRAAARSATGIDAVLDAAVEEFDSDATLRARLQLDGEQWEWVPMLAPDIVDFAGKIHADIHASGSLRSPDLRGDLTWTDGQFAVPAVNLPLSDIDVTVSGSRAGDMTISGDASAGDGRLRVRGRLDDVTSRSPSFAVSLTGERATLLNWQDYLVVASPELEFNGTTESVHVAGRVTLDKAEIRVSELPEGAVTPSDDVSVVGRDPNVGRRTRVSGELDLLLSEDIHINAFGLDTNLAGELRFTLPENREPQGNGELRLVGGVFEAYGQRLEIESGTMVFSGPLDDPLIDVRAVRKVDSIDGTITVGIHLTGRSQNLASTLFSDPSMSEAETLSYLVLGRPLSQATEADGSNLSDSAYSLGLRQAALVTNQIGQAVGLDELTVGGGNQNTTELIAGKQINSRLYARYAYGVFNRLGKLLMRYRLSDSFSIEIGAGENQSMDILYTIERE